MFEGWILGLLNRLLGEYVKEDCLSRDRLRADVYNGHVCLEQLELRESAFDFLNEPVTLIKGYIGQVELKVSGGSWTNIMSKPVEVWFDRIHLLLSPKFDWDEDDREEREQQIKQALLRRAELFAMHRASQKSSSGGSATGAPDHSGGDSFIERLMTKLVDNVEFHVRNVHIRYEDHLSNPLQPFALGLTFNKLHLKSTNEHYQEVYVNRAGDKEAQRGIFKHIALHKLSAYCNLISEDNPLGSINIDTCSYETWQSVFSRGVSSPAGGGEGNEAFRGSNLSQTSRSSSLASLSSSSMRLTEELSNTATNPGSNIEDATEMESHGKSQGSVQSGTALNSGAASGGDSGNQRPQGATPQEMHYLLRPLDIDVRLRVNRDPFDLTSPRVRVQCRLDDFALELERSQYHALLFLSSAFECQARQARYRRFRPRHSSVSDDPKGWWIYAYNAVTLDIREHRSRWTPEYFHTRRQDRLEYMLLWKRKRVGSAVRSADDRGNGLYRELSGYDRGRLERLEYRLDLDDIMFFRALAEKDLEKTESLRAAAEREHREAQRGGIVEIGSGLLSWVFSGGDGSTASSSGNRNDSNGANVALSATERNKMLRELKLDSKDTNLTNFDYPKSYDMLCMDFSMENFHVNLTGDFRGCAAQVLCMQLSEVRMTLSKRVDSQKIALSIDGLNIFDPCMHPKRMEHRIVRQRKHSGRTRQSNSLILDPLLSSSMPTGMSVQATTDGSNVIEVDNEVDERGREEDIKLPSSRERSGHLTQSKPSIFSLTVELFSDIGAKSQARIRLVSGPLELIYSPKCLERVGRVFEYPSDLGRRMENAVADLNSLSSLEARAKAKLEFAMSSHARVDIDVRARAPVIIIPEQLSQGSYEVTTSGESKEVHSAGWNSMDPPSSLEEDIRLLFVFDLGRFHVWSRDQNTDSLRNPASEKPTTPELAAVEVAASAGHNDDGSSAKRSSAFEKNNDKFYDRYRLRLSEIQMMLVRGAEPWRTAPSQTSTLVHKFECIVDLHASILPQDPTIARAKIYGKLPKIHGKISTRMRRNLIQLMSSLKQQSAADSSYESANVLGGSGNTGAFDGKHKWGGVAASATAAAAGFGNPASSMSLFARARSVAATFSPASGPSRAPRLRRVPGSSKLSQGIFAFPSPSAKYHRLTRSPSPLNIGINADSAFRSSASTALGGSAREGVTKTDDKDSKKSDRKLFDLNLFLGSVIIDVSESSTGEELSSNSRSSHRMPQSNQKERSVAQFALDALELTSSLGSRSMQAEIILSEVVVKDTRVLNRNTASTIPEPLRMVVSRSGKTKSISDALIRIKYSTKDGVRSLVAMDLSADDDQSKSKHARKSLRPVHSRIEVLLGQVRFRCNQRFLVRLQNVFLDNEMLSPSKRMVSNQQFLNVSNDATDRVKYDTGGRQLSKTAGTPSRLPTVDDGPSHAPPAPPAGTRQNPGQKTNTSVTLRPTKLKVILSIAGVELFFDSEKNLNTTSLRGERKKEKGKRRHTLAKIALLRSSATFSLETQDLDTVSFYLAGHVGNATLADFSNDSEVEIFGLRMLRQIESLNKSGHYRQDEKSSDRKAPLVSTPSNVATPALFDRSSNNTFLFAPVNRNVSSEKSTPKTTGPPKIMQSANKLASFQVSMNLRSDNSKLNASIIHDDTELDDHIRLSVTLRPVKCVLLASFVDSTIRYVRDGSLMKSINEDKTSSRMSANLQHRQQQHRRQQQEKHLGQEQQATAVAGTGPPPVVSVQIQMQNPLIVLPRSSTSLEAVFIDLGNIEISSKFTEQSELPPSISGSTLTRQKFTVRCIDTHIDCRFANDANAPIHKILDDNTITIELETDIPGSATLAHSSICASASLSPVCFGINPELVTLMLLVWYENIALFQNINWSIMPAEPNPVALPSSVLPAKFKSAHARKPSSVNHAHAHSRKSPSRVGARAQKHAPSQSSSPIPSVTSPSTSRHDMAPLNLDNAAYERVKAFDFTFRASEIKIVVLNGEKSKNSSKSPRATSGKKGIDNHRRSVGRVGILDHATSAQSWQPNQVADSRSSVQWDQPICTRTLLVSEYREIVCLCVENLTSHTFSNNQGDSELNLTVRSIVLKDCHPQNDCAPFGMRSTPNLFSTLMHASSPSSLEPHEATLSLRRVYHSKRGDVDITLDLKGGPRIYFVPKVFEELSLYMSGLLEETKAIQVEYASLVPKVVYPYKNAPKPSRPPEIVERSDNLAPKIGHSSTRHRKLLTDARGEDRSAASTAPMQQDSVSQVDAPELSFKLSASQPELWLIADPTQEQTWTIIMSCSVDRRAVCLRFPRKRNSIYGAEDLTARLDDGEWEMTEQSVILDRCRVIARVANVGDLRTDLETNINNLGEEGIPPVSGGRANGDISGDRINLSGLPSGGEHTSGSGSRFRRRATVPLQIVDNFKLCTDYSIKKTNNREASEAGEEDSGPQTSDYTSFDSGYDTHRSSANLYFDEVKHFRYRQHAHTALQLETCGNLKRRVVISVSPVVARLGYHDLQLVLTIMETFSSHAPASEPSMYSTHTAGIDFRTPKSSNGLELGSVPSDYRSNINPLTDTGRSSKVKVKATASNEPSNSVPSSSNSASSAPSFLSIVPYGHLDVRIAAINLMLNNDVFGQNIPIAEARLASVVGIAESTSGAVRCSMEITFESVYHNLRLMAWEPAIEPWRCRMEAYLPKANSKDGNLNASWSTGDQGYAEKSGVLSAAGGGTTAISSETSDSRAISKGSSRGLRQRTSGLSGLSDLSERDANYASENTGAWESGTVTPAARESPITSGIGSPATGLNGLGEWAGDRVGAEGSASADLVTHRPSIAVSSTSTLNINVTEAVVENFLAVSKGWKVVAEQQQTRKKQIYERKQSMLRKAGNAYMRTPAGSLAASRPAKSPETDTSSGSLEREQFSLYRVRNETGLALKFWGSNGSARSMLLQPNQEQPMRFDLVQPSFMPRGLGRGARMITVVAQAQRKFVQSSSEEKTRTINSTSDDVKATSQSSNTFENLILLRCEQVRVDTMGTSIHGMRSFDKNDYYLNGNTNNASTDELIDELAQDKNSRVIAERAPSLICQVRSRAGSKIIHLRSPILLRNETDVALLFVICDPRRRQSQEQLILWREVARPSGTVAYPLHLSSNRLFVLKMVPCKSVSCPIPIAGADYCVVPVFENAADQRSDPEIFTFETSANHVSERTQLHIGCCVRYNEDAEEVLAKAEIVSNSGAYNITNGDATSAPSSFRSGVRRRSNGASFMRVLSFHPTMRIQSTLPQSMQYRIFIEVPEPPSNTIIVSEVPDDEQRRNADAKEPAKKYIPDTTVPVEKRAHRKVEIHSEGMLSPGATVLWYGPTFQQQKYRLHRNADTVSKDRHGVYIEVRIPGFAWSQRKCLSTLTHAVRRRSEINVPITLLDGMNRPLELQMELSQSGASVPDSSMNRTKDGSLNGRFGVLEVSIYAPYWIHNASGLPLLFRHHGVQNDSRFRRSGGPTDDSEKGKGREAFVRGTTTAAGQPGELIDTDVSETVSLASSSEGHQIGLYSGDSSSERGSTRAKTSVFGLSKEVDNTLASKIETESVFLGTGPRNMGLKELVSGPQGTERPGLREALRVGLVAHRKRFAEERSQLLARRPGSNLSLEETEQKQATTPMSYSIPDDYDYEEAALLRAGVFDDDEIVGFGDRAGATNSVRPEDLLLLGYSKPSSRTGRLSVRLAKGMDSTHSTATFHALLPTDWSKPFGIDSAGTTGEVEIKEEESSDNATGWHLGKLFGRRTSKPQWGGAIPALSSSGVEESSIGDEISQAAYSLGVSIDVARSPFHRTKVISIMPRFVLVNLMGRPLLVKQLGTSGRRYVGGPGGDGTGVDALLVGADQRVPFHWADSSGGWNTDGRSRRVVSVRFDEYGWQWSGGFPIHNVGEFSVRLRNLHTHASYICRVEVFMLQATLFVVFQAELRRLPPYRIENMSFATLHYHQEGVSHIEDVLLPYQTSRYSWDEIMAGNGSSHKSGPERDNADMTPGNTGHGTFAAAKAITPVAKRIVFTAVGTANQPHPPVHLGAFSLDKIAEYGHGKVSLCVELLDPFVLTVFRLTDPITL